MRIVSGGYDVTAGYCVKVEGTVATATLAPPVLPAVAGDKKDEAAWGDDLDSLTAGERVRATGGTLYLGVIRQTGKKGFYKVSVSEK